MLKQGCDPLAKNRHMFLEKCREMDLSTNVICMLTKPMADKSEKEKEEVATLLFKILSRASNEKVILEAGVKTFGTKIMTEAVEYLKMLDRLKEKMNFFEEFLDDRNLPPETQATILSKLDEEERIDEMLSFVKNTTHFVSECEISNKAEEIAKKYETKKDFMWTLSYYYINDEEVEAMLRLLPTMEQQKKLIDFRKKNYRTIKARDLWCEAKRISAICKKSQ